MERNITNYIDAISRKYNWSNVLNGLEIGGADISNLSPDYLNDLAATGDLLNIEIAIEKGLDVNKANEIGRYPIHEAAANGHLEMIKLLLERGADIDAVLKPFGHTALYIAVEKGYHQIAKFLIKNKARLYVTDRLTNRTLLHVAAKKDDTVMAGILVAAGINTLLCDREEQTARDIAAKNNNKQLEKTLLTVMQHHAMLLDI